ncbi:hypothetical protein DSO57_1010984 [Entomophthora muscae]|uniref:Uncharacterized protein n=1 Tax=Entomophthora muscae TaxID=34485 RepID=A0ACC2UTD7_9FUNG|nr:hypothetical protein DSO57_1010984 [Entomophthora muscae]
MSPEFKAFLGVVVLLVSSCLDALGYNIQRRDHCKNNASAKPRKECYRKYWHLGLYIYIGSSVIGNIVGLQLINAHCVAPLTTSSLVFNVIFARYLVGSRITRKDMVGTAIIIFAILSLLAVTALAPTREDKVAVIFQELKALFNTTAFLVCIISLNAILIVGMFVYLFLAPKAIRVKDEIRKRNLATSFRCLESCATIFQAMHSGQWSSDGFSALIVLGVDITGALQLFCLNGGLKLADNVLVGPVFSSVYNVFALFNTLVFLKKYELTRAWAICLTGLIVIVLVIGIVILASQLKPEAVDLPRLKTPRNQTYNIPLIAKDTICSDNAPCDSPWD